MNWIGWVIVAAASAAVGGWFALAVKRELEHGQPLGDNVVVFPPLPPVLSDCDRCGQTAQSHEITGLYDHAYLPPLPDDFDTSSLDPIGDVDDGI